MVFKIKPPKDKKTESMKSVKKPAKTQKVKK